MKGLSKVFVLTALATSVAAVQTQPASGSCWTTGAASIAGPATCPSPSNGQPRADNTFYVCLVPDPTNPNQLVVGIDDDNGNACVVGHKNNPQTITWLLTDKAHPNAVFLGFTWLNTRPSNPPLGNFEIAPDGKSATMSDKHPTGDPTGSWPYQLFVEADGKTYFVGKKPIRTNTNPNIKNN